MIRKTIIMMFLILPWVAGWAQPERIRVAASNQPLNEVLLHLRDQYNFHFSYSDNELAEYRVSVSKVFTSKEEAVIYLLTGLPFSLKKIDDVFIIIPDNQPQKEEYKKKQTKITGHIVERGSQEPLPFSSIVINNHPVLADVNGSFHFISTDDSLFHVRISHLGYYVYDTVLVASNNRQYKLTPSTQSIAEILVKDHPVEYSTIMGENIGKMTINPTISRYLPGQGDNAVFNLLRLMPGIQAAGEQSTDLVIWGGYEGQSLVTFDKFTLFGLKNYNDNITVVNPFLVKTMEVLKGGFEAKYGDRVGGIVNIIGKNGHMQKPVLSLNINPTTLNGMIELPLFKRSSLLMAYRQTYYNLYSSSDFNLFSRIGTGTKGQPNSQKLRDNFDLSVYPDDYQFRDMNIKYSLNFDNGDHFYVSTYGGGDYFHLTADATINRPFQNKNQNTRATQLQLDLLNKEKNRQYGLSAFFNRKWSNRMATQLLLTYSDFSRNFTEEIHTTDSLARNIYKNDRDSTANGISEYAFRIDNLYHLLNGHKIEFGAGIYHNTARIFSNRKTQNTLAFDSLFNFSNTRAFLYFDDYLPLGNRWMIKTGARLNLSDNSQKVHFEPRISVSYQFAPPLKVTASWGRYHQFIYKEAFVGKDQNYSYLWVTSNGNTSVIGSAHWVAEINYSRNNLTFNVEGYFKQTSNLTRRVFEQHFDGRKLRGGFVPYFGEARTFGIDLFAKKDWRKHSLWASYTLGKTQESLAKKGEGLPAWSLAPHHQQHELKMAGIYNIGPFYLSANYVYGSGLEILRKVFPLENSDFAYHRVDAALTYRFTPKKVSGEIGFSVLNLFNTQNLKYGNLKSFQITPELGDIRIYSNAVPFTPALFLKLVF